MTLSTTDFLRAAEQKGEIRLDESNPDRIITVRSHWLQRLVQRVFGRKDEAITAQQMRVKKEFISAIKNQYGAQVAMQAQNYLIARVPERLSSQDVRKCLAIVNKNYSKVIQDRSERLSRVYSRWANIDPVNAANSYAGLMGMVADRLSLRYLLPMVTEYSPSTQFITNRIKSKLSDLLSGDSSSISNEQIARLVEKELSKYLQNKDAMISEAKKLAHSDADFELLAQTIMNSSLDGVSHLVGLRQNAQTLSGLVQSMARSSDGSSIDFEVFNQYCKQFDALLLSLLQARNTTNVDYDWVQRIHVDALSLLGPSLTSGTSAKEILQCLHSEKMLNLASALKCIYFDGESFGLDNEVRLQARYIYDLFESIAIAIDSSGQELLNYHDAADQVYFEGVDEFPLDVMSTLGKIGMKDVRYSREHAVGALLQGEEKTLFTAAHQNLSSAENSLSRGPLNPEQQSSLQETLNHWRNTLSQYALDEQAPNLNMRMQLHQQLKDDCQALLQHLDGNFYGR